MLDAVTSWNPRSLSERQQLILRLAALGLSPRSIVDCTGCPKTHVHKLLATQQGRCARREFCGTATMLPTAADIYQHLMNDENAHTETGSALPTASWTASCRG